MGYRVNNDRHLFGSVDTQAKLSCLKQYLQAYSIALKNKGFQRVYIDAFAGTGSRTVTRAALPIFSDGEENAMEVNTPGSARIALEVEPGFTNFLFIEQDPIKAQALQQLVDQHRERGVRASVTAGDANDIVQRLCRNYNWHKDNMRGVIFLDPYGMEVSWETVQAIAETKALDCWYFFPLSGLYRNAPRDSSKLDQSKTDSLTRLFGTDLWRTEWYAQEEGQTDLFSQESRDYRAFDVERIEEWVRQRLMAVFKGTVLKPLRLRHSNKAPMASLFFAVSNPHPQAVKVASDIAGHILKAGISSQVRSR
jgi:three-Cys-motif partner protein